MSLETISSNEPDSQEYFMPSTSGKYAKAPSIQLKNTVIVGQRYGVSDRAIAAIASSVLNDANVVAEGSTNHVFDRNKVSKF